MKESTFIASIDCCFPYHDHVRALELAGEACSISPNAAFAIVDEILRPPVGQTVSKALSAELFSFIEKQLCHPLAQSMMALARKLATVQFISVDESVRALRLIEQFPGQYAALSVAYFACDDIDGVADAELVRIRAAWDVTRPFLRSHVAS